MPGAGEKERGGDPDRHIEIDKLGSLSRKK